MHFNSEQLLDNDVLERGFILDDIPGILWTGASSGPLEPRPLLLLGHPGGLATNHHRLLSRARTAIESGFAAATIELPGNGHRPSIPALDQARVELRQALEAHQAPTDDVIDRLVLPLVEQAVPEWRAAITALQALPEIDERIGYAGGVISIGIRLALIEPRIVAAGLFAGSYIPMSTFNDARQLRIPVHVLLQWDDHDNDRNAALDLFDALGSREKTLQANMGGHTGVPSYAGEDAARFFTRHLKV